MTKDKRNPVSAGPTKFGTFGGVFTPSLLTILGVILFLRLSTVVGYAGLWGALAILLAAKAIIIVTALSLSSISTNMRVRGGGAYYLISRSLGVESGGVIAVFFFVAQAVVVTLYVIGFAEALDSAFPALGLPIHALATLTNLAVFICVYIGAGWTIRLQYGILAILLLSIGSFVLGAWGHAAPETLEVNLVAHWAEDGGFFKVFALFFPAVTGIMAGVNMSGNLQKPGRSIPVGTFASIGVSALIYASVAVLLAASATHEELLGGGFVMKEKAWSGPLVYAGVMSATLSSALGSMMGAPRILQAFARDNIFKNLKWFGHGSGASGEPRRAIVLTFLIAQAGILAGDLDSIAPIITMFFLLTYGTVNLACFYEIISHNPSFRPTFRFNHWIAALFGALGCLAVMFLINPLWALVAIILVAGLYVMIKRARIIVQWGDLESGLAYQQARKALLRLEQERYHPKNWRPSILALSGGAWKQIHLAEYACWLAADHGIVSLCQVISGDLENLFDRRLQAEANLRSFISDERLPAFPVVVVEDDIKVAIKALLQCHGVGGMRPNTLLLGWSDDPHTSPIFSETLSVAKKMQRSVLVVACNEEQERGYVPDGVINVWWENPKVGSLMLLLAFLLKKNPEWRDCPIRVLRPVELAADVDGVTRKMQSMLSVARIDAEIVILPTADPLAAVRESMQPSSVLFAGFEPPDEDPTGSFPSSLQKIIDLPSDVILVYNAGDVSLLA